MGARLSLKGKKRAAGGGGEEDERKRELLRVIPTKKNDVRNLIRNRTPIYAFTRPVRSAPFLATSQPTSHTT